MQRPEQSPTEVIFDDRWDAARYYVPAVTSRRTQSAFMWIARRWIPLYDLTQQLCLSCLFCLLFAPLSQFPGPFSFRVFVAMAGFFVLHLFVRGKLTSIAHRHGGFLDAGSQAATWQAPR